MRAESQSPAIDGGGISFFCVARGSTILHSRSSGDGELEALAAACLARTPPRHARCSHTARDRTFAFLVAGDGRTYFAIADGGEGSGPALRFLERLRDAFERGGGAEGLAPRAPAAKERAIEVGSGNGADRAIRTIADEKAGTKGLRRSLSARACACARARKLWWRHVRVVLALDALLCAALLGLGLRFAGDSNAWTRCSVKICISVQNLPSPTIIYIYCIHIYIDTPYT
uniref:Longin domain-containing protein n=1 Tax=Ananas comosus var. bracteatus TaxID=296719 RepID=A0A6V7QGI5_ANACO|nr:unnamed protein product [Ananas comosus var. bracteatus]